LAHINMGIQNLPKVAKDTSDRNRTSPIAFTGNKFEFRAVGSNQNCSEAATMLNLIAACGYDELCDRLSKMSGDVKTNAILLLKDVLKETKRVRFEGNNYSEDWHKEAAKRGLPNDKNTPTALELFLKDDSMKLFEKYGVLSHKELHSKIDIKLEAFIKIKEIEFKAAINIAKTMILPAVARYISEIAGAACATSNAGIKSKALADEVTNLDSIYIEIKDGINNLESTLASCEKETNLLKQAHLFAENGADALQKLRIGVDKAEEVVADDLWPMAKYQELLTVL
jgi:glutamine synthetase